MKNYTNISIGAYAGYGYAYEGSTSGVGKLCS